MEPNSTNSNTAISPSDESIEKRQNRYKKAYEMILSGAMAENTPFDKLKQELTDYYEKFVLSDEKKFQIIINALTSMTQGITISSQEIALRLVLENDMLDKKLELADKEAEFNRARTELVRAQAKSEEARKMAIERETKSFDDRLNIEEAKCLKDVVFGYAVGGTSVPSDLQTTMLNAIDKISKE